MFVSIMEDDGFIAEQMVIYFQSKGARVEHFEDGEALLESGNLPHYDIFLLDVDTPRVNGFEALSYLRYPLPILRITSQTHI